MPLEAPAFKTSMHVETGDGIWKRAHDGSVNNYQIQQAKREFKQARRKFKGNEAALDK